jgi:signal transduction histidine kinase
MKVSPFRRAFRSPLVLTAVTGVMLVAVFAVMVMIFRGRLRDEIRGSLIEREASLLRPFALRQLAQREAVTGERDLLSAVLDSAQQENVLAVAVFDPQAEPLQFAPDSLLFAELSLSDYTKLLSENSISRFHASFPLSRYFAGVAPSSSAPVLEVLISLHGKDPKAVLGYAQYYLDGRPLAAELARTDVRINRQTAATLAIGTVLIVTVLALAFARLKAAQSVIDRRTEQLVRTNFELSLAVKASALGQITSHLIHGLQGPVAGLREMVARHDAGGSTDWDSAANYTARMQTMIQDAVALLGDANANVAYELSGYDLVEIVRQRNEARAVEKGVRLAVGGGFEATIDNHRGSLLCLITSNLVENAIEATDRGRSVTVNFGADDTAAMIRVSDEGHGIPEEIRAHLFEPGKTGRPTGSGLGLAISQLLARQIGAALELDSTSPTGTVFRVTLPLTPM